MLRIPAGRYEICYPGLGVPEPIEVFMCAWKSQRNIPAGVATLGIQTSSSRCWVSLCLARPQAWQVVDWRNQRGMTALHLAAACNNVEVVQWLLWSSASPPPHHRPPPPCRPRFARRAHVMSGVRRIAGCWVFFDGTRRQLGLVAYIGCLVQGCWVGPSLLVRERWPGAAGVRRCRRVLRL